MSISINRTNVTPTQLVGQSETLTVKVQGKPMVRFQSIKLLGVHFDERLTWNEHISKLPASCLIPDSTCAEEVEAPGSIPRKKTAGRKPCSHTDYACIGESLFTYCILPH